MNETRDPDLNEMARTWIAFQYSDRGSPERSALALRALAIDDLAKKDPHSLLEVIRIVLQTDTSPKIISNLGAGLIEDLLRISGQSVISEVEALARSSNVFRDCLSCTWFHSIDPAIKERIQHTIDSTSDS